VLIEYEILVLEKCLQFILSCVAQAPSAMEVWEWGADDDGRWRWLPWHGPGSDGGSGLSVTKHNNCRANRVANRQNERDRLRANCEAKDEVIQDLEKKLADLTANCQAKDDIIQDLEKKLADQQEKTVELGPLVQKTQELMKELQECRSQLQWHRSQQAQQAVDVQQLKKQKQTTEDLGPIFNLVLVSK
jgi:predicted RNase H-like nuclease (RuvC/YqgF family)